ncbi:MAG: MBL fold metallo-hydrolase [Candidatus Omnitrophota bacterium]
MILERVCVGELEVNCYVVAGDGSPAAVVIDPGSEKDKIAKVLAKHKLKAVAVINTHGHIDHIGCDDDFGVPVYCSEKDAKLLKDSRLNLSGFLSSPFSVKSAITQLKDNQVISLAGIEFKVIHTPGHTPGGICLLVKDEARYVLFSGDSLFRSSVGRSDFEGADGEALINSIKERLLVLPDETVVYPGHGPATTIGYEKEHNPFLV